MNVCHEYIFSGCWMPDDFRERINYLFPTCNMWEITTTINARVYYSRLFYFIFYIFLGK
jgi:hypothetical protein